MVAYSILRYKYGLEDLVRQEISSPGGISSDILEARAVFGDAIKEAANLVSRRALLDIRIYMRRVDDVLYYEFCLLKSQRPSTTSEKLANTETLNLLWAKVWDAPRIQKYRLSLRKGKTASADGALHPAEAKWKDKIKRNAPVKWRAFKSRYDGLAALESRIVKRLFREFGISDETS